MKEGIRAIGIDDGPLMERTLVVGVVMRRDRVEGILSTRIELDGNEATDALIKMLKGSRFFPQLHVVFINGVALAGLNLVDLQRLSEVLSLPVIAVTPNMPHPEELEKLLQRFPEKMNIWKRIKKKPILMKTPRGPVWFQPYGVSRKEATELLRMFTLHSKIPEPLRLAHLIAAGIELGESKGTG